MTRTYTVAVDRPGFGDIPELACAESSEVAAALVKALLDCHDDKIRVVRVQINQMADV